MNFADNSGICRQIPMNFSGAKGYLNGDKMLNLGSNPDDVPNQEIFNGIFATAEQGQL